MKAKIAKLPVPSLSQEILLWEDEYQRLVSDGISFREAQEEERWRSTVKLNLDEHEVNLREREFIGGVITFEIFHQPPQPKYLRYKHDVTLLREPPRLQPVEYQVTLPSAKHDGGTDEDRLLRKRRDVQGARKEDLIFVSLNLPQSVLWLEIPDIALWNNEKQYWSTEFIHEQYYDDEDGRLTFKTGCIGLFGFHISRFCNLPYKDWRLESDGKGGVNFYLKADKITLNFNIKDDKVCLSSVEDVPSSPIDSIFNTYYIPIKLVQVMKSFGVNVFPEIDTHFYLPDSISKHGVCERFVYQIWGIFSSSFCFKFSKFNRERERRTMVFQLREVYDSFDTSFCLIKTTPSEACILDITESAEEYTPRVAPLYKVYTNVYDLIMRNSSTMARRRAEVENFVLIQTIRDFLGLVRPLSFS
ncbi:UNVERIFIED_CONTAM: hypothetical protein PYX00_002991 [Menopon gallinae]|uniref:CASC1 C-terminal domain-containing protein n=1 Tax=Menopon gallinae TaxID=328185 RepID=A0AAW2HYP8_9NEOP